jgi:hypothetical protein
MASPAHGRPSRSLLGRRHHKAFDFRSKMAEETGRRGVLGGESAAAFDTAMVHLRVRDKFMGD